MTNTLFATLAAATLFATSAHAQQTYIGATIAAGTNWTYREAPGRPGTDEKVLFGKLYGGYAFNETWSLEGGFGTYEKARFAKADTGALQDATFEASMLYMAARATHRFNDKWSVSGKFGAVRHSQEHDQGKGNIRNHAVRPMFGLGVSYDLTPAAALTLELHRYGTVRTAETMRRVGTLEAGVKFSF